MGEFLKVAGEDLCLYVRHSAWLSASPERAKSDKSETPIKSRLDQLKGIAGDEDYEPMMPEPGEAAYLLAHFREVGPTLGDAAISSGELRDYQENMGVHLSPWECKTLRRLSIEYLNETHRATKAEADKTPPFADAIDEAVKLRQAALRRNMRAFLES